MAFELNYKNQFFVDMLSETEAAKRIGAGISTFGTESNEETDDTAYLDGNGVSTSDVIGGQPAVTFEGHRFYGDEAQDFVFSLKHKYNQDRVVQFKWVQPDGTTLTGPATIMNIEGPGGDANAKGEISFEVRFRGAPTITEGTAPTPEG